MSDKQPIEQLEAGLRELAAALPYPPTPDLAARLRERPATRPQARRRLRLALGLLAALLALLAVPQVRAAVARAIQLGAISIRFEEPTPAPAEPLPPTPIASLLDLAGETTLEQAAQSLPYPIRLPSYPAQLGPPDRAFLQVFDRSRTMLVLIWLDPQQPDGIGMSLTMLDSSALADKGFVVKTGSEILQEVRVGGERALWLRGPHFLEIRRGDGQSGYDLRRLVEGEVLIWTEGDLTYRLESHLALAEAIRVAESLR
jgi:hypothetical protein